MFSQHAAAARRDFALDFGNEYGTINHTLELREFLDGTGRSPFGRWLDGLDAIASARIVTALSRLALGNTSRVKALGGGVNELKIDFGPGYRVYFGYDGLRSVLLLAGGTKKRQGDDIARASSFWRLHKTRRGET